MCLAMNRATGELDHDREDAGARHREAVAGEPADGDEPRQAVPLRRSCAASRIPVSTFAIDHAERQAHA